MKQVFHNKGASVDQHGARQRTMPFEDFWEHDGTKLKQFPIPQQKPLSLACTLDQLAQQLQATLPAALVERATPEAETWQQAEAEAARLREQMIAWQEELDWQCYRIYGLTEEELTLGAQASPPAGLRREPLVSQSPPAERGQAGTPALPGVKLGERAFEIVLARKMAAGELKTSWFERHGSTPITELPAHWPDEYKRLVERRIALIESDHNINLIEQPELKATQEEVGLTTFRVHHRIVKVSP